MTIEILYFEGCPSAEPTVALVREVVRELRIQAEVRAVEVHHSYDVARLRFLGSPTVQVDGHDIESSAEYRIDYSFSCRTYGNSGVPPWALIEAALLTGKLA